jgi:hypothetical protein
MTDSAELAKQGYKPTSQTWAPGNYDAAAFIFAAILCFFCIGFIVLFYMLIVKPPGTLTVTYELQSEPISTDNAEKTCPMCAETVKAAALVCRYCGHRFD